MLTNSCGNRNFMQPMERLSMHSKCLDFFSFEVWGGVRGWGGYLRFCLPGRKIRSRVFGFSSSSATATPGEVVAW